MRKAAAVMTCSMLLTLGFTSVGNQALATKGVMTKSVIVVGEKAAAQSFGDCINRADLIVLGEYKEHGIVNVKTVLKGDQTWVGKPLVLAQPIMMGCRQQLVPNIKSAALLIDSKILYRNSKRGDNCVVEIYDTPDQIAYLRCLVPIYSIKSEHERLARLGELFATPKSCKGQEFESDPDATFKKEFVWAISKMREPANFDLVKRLYLDPKLAPKDKLSLQDWIADTRDNRAVPLLILALQSKDHFIVSDAASKLIAYYSGPSTDAELQRVLKILPDDTRPMVASYLASHGIKIAGTKVPPPTPFQAAETLRLSGKTAEATAIYLSILESSETNGYVLRSAAANALKFGDALTKTRVLKSRINWLNHDAATGNYLEANDTAEILRKLHSNEALPGLISLLSRRDFLFNSANRTATMAIVELGPAARKTAAAVLLKEMSESDALDNNPDDQLRLLLGLAWIKQPGDYENAAKIVDGKASWSTSWKNVQPIVHGVADEHEGAGLTKLLDGQISGIPLDWIVFRVGDLREIHAIPALVHIFEAPSLNPQTVSDALESIGGEQVAGKIEAIALNNNSTYQGPAVELYANCKKAKALPLLRKVLKTGSLNARVRSLAAISRYGTCDDRKMLISMADYWTGERDIHYWLIQAISEIGSRCKCN